MQNPHLTSDRTSNQIITKDIDFEQPYQQLKLTVILEHSTQQQNKYSFKCALTKVHCITQYSA